MLVEPLPGGFALNLTPAMRAELLTPLQALPLRPDFGRAEAPLMLPADSLPARLVRRGRVRALRRRARGGGGAAPVRRGAGATHARYDAGVALALLALLLIVRAVPEDPRAAVAG